MDPYVSGYLIATQLRHFLILSTLKYSWIISRHFNEIDNVPCSLKSLFRKKVHTYIRI